MNKNKKIVRDPEYFIQLIAKNMRKEKDVPTLINFRNVMGEKHFMTAKKKRTTTDPYDAPVSFTEYYEKKLDIIKDWEHEPNFVRWIDLWEPCKKKGKKKTAETTETAETAETVETEKVAETTESVETVEAVEISEATEAAKTAETVKLAGHDESAENTQPNKIRKWLRFIAVEGPNGKKFPVPPTYEMVINKHKTQYLWRLKSAVPDSMRESVQLLAASIAYLAPGCKSMHTSETARIRVPGVPDVMSGKTGTFDKVGDLYDYSEIEKKVYKHLPVVGKSLRKFLKSEAVYVPGLKTTHQFIGLDRLNKLLNAGKKLTKKVFYKSSASFLYFAWTFGRDVGMEDDEIMRLLQNYCMRHFRKVTDRDIVDAKPVRTLRFRDVSIVKSLGDWAAKYFTYVAKNRTPMATIHERVETARREVARLAGEGHTIREIAAELGLTISTVKRHRSFGVKNGLIVNPT